MRNLLKTSNAWWFAIGVAIVGCGGDGGGASSAAGGSCGKVAACGGSVVGTWTTATACAGVLPGSSFPLSDCQNARAQGATVAASGTATFNMDLTYSAELNESVSETFIWPMSCLTGGGRTMTCDQLTFPGPLGSDGGAGSCAPSGSNCNCTVPFVNGPTIHETGTYSLVGTKLQTMSADGTTHSVDYCVQGATLHRMSSITNLGISTDIVATKN